MMRKGILILLVILLMAGCSVQDSEPVEDTVLEMIEMTIEEVAEYNGKNGAPIYVVVDGEIYDVTDHPQWSSGSHGGNMAGTDITDMLVNNASHGRSKLSEISKIGMIVED